MQTFWNAVDAVRKWASGQRPESHAWWSLWIKWTLSVLEKGKKNELQRVEGTVEPTQIFPLTNPCDNSHS